MEGRTMGLIDRLRKAELRGRDAATRAFDRVVHTSEDIERKLRRKMRVYPTTTAARNQGGSTPSEVSQSVPAGESAPVEYQEQRKGLEIVEEPAEKKPIVSINGKDVQKGPGPLPKAPDVKKDTEAA
jgi:hypothetical protein